MERVGPFKVIRELGRGGMGVVYLARDTRLDRDVAIKAMPADLAADPARLERFEREARTLAQLNHPNLAGIHGVEKEGAAQYLVLEYVDGESLADRLERGPLPIEDATELAVQIATGLETAHEAGVVHRDLKPANVMITPCGQAKVLDFGLARTQESGLKTSTGLDSPTRTTPQPQHSPTIEGAILGTAAYMSPEQARGRRVDKRTDIWSFGVVLYEMLVGVSPFYGETATDSIGAVLHKDLDLDRLPPGTPARVRRVLARCLKRDPRERYHDLADVRLDLTEPETMPLARPSRSRTLYLPWVLAGLALAWLLIAGTVWTRPGEPAPPPGSLVRLTIPPPSGASYRLSGDLSGPAVISPDGTRIAFSAVREGSSRRLWLRDLSENEPLEIDGTDGAMFPFWSPDGRHIGFFTPLNLLRFDTVSGTIEHICPAAQARGGAWTDDGRIVFASRFRGPLSVVDAGGGTPEPFTTLDEDLHTSHRWPRMIPGTNRLLFIAVSNRPDEAKHNAIYLADLSNETPPKRIMRSDYGASFADGHLLFVRDGTLLARPFDADSGTFTGESRPLARDVDPNIATWHAQLSVSRTGALVYSAHATPEDAGRARKVSGGYSWDMNGDRIIMYEYDGRITTTYADGTPIRDMALNDAGTILAYETVGEDEFIDIWLHPTAFDPDGIESGVDPEIVRDAIIDLRPRRFTSLPGAEVVPTWSPDGTEIAFRWDGDDTRPRGVYRKGIGDGTITLVRDNQGADDYPMDWTPDGRFLVITTGTLLFSEFNDVWAAPVDGSDAIPLVTEPGIDILPQVSPDGRWLAYTRIEDGRWEVRVIPFAPAWPEQARDRMWVVSEGGGIMPRWAPEGDELFFIDQDARLLAVDVDLSGDSFNASAPRVLFQTEWDVGRLYDPTPRLSGGDRRFFFVDLGDESQKPLRLLLNWHHLIAVN